MLPFHSSPVHYDLILLISSFLHFSSPTFLDLNGFSENLVLCIKEFLDLRRCSRSYQGTWERHLNLRARVVGIQLEVNHDQ